LVHYGQAPMDEKTERFEMRFPEGFLRKLDEWRGKQDDLPSRAEAIRRLVEYALSVPAAQRLPPQSERSPEPVVTAAPAKTASLWPMPTEVQQAISTARQPITQRSPKAASKASDMAGQQIDKLGDASATVEERQSRKRRLLKGPKEFRDIRALAEQPKRKK
jgi:hypothetical protein